jgi:hypothetical protein
MSVTVFAATDETALTSALDAAPQALLDVADPHNDRQSDRRSFEDAAAPQALPKLGKRRRSRYDKSPKSGPVNVERFREGGVEIVRVPLFGRGFGQRMELAAVDWDDGRDNEGWPECWVLRSNGTGSPPYVVSGKRCVGRQAKQRSGVPVAYMARLIVDAQRGEVVRYLDGNPLNLRRSNLLKLDRKAAARWRSEWLAAGGNRL